MKKVLIVMLTVFMMSTALYAETAIGVRGGIALGFHDVAKDQKDSITESGGSIDSVYVNPNIALFVAFGLTDNIAIQTELNFMINQGIKISGVFIDEEYEYDYYSNNYYVVEHRYPYTQEVTYTSLDIPLLLKFSFDSGFGFLVGPHLSIPLGKIAIKQTIGGVSQTLEFEIDGATYGLTAGMFFGLPVGPGRFIGDFRFAFDFTAVRMKQVYGGSSYVSFDLATRRALALTIGYEFSF